MHSAFVLVSIYSTFVCPLCHFFDEEAIFSLHFSEFIFLKHESFIWIEGLWVPLPLTATRSYIPEPLLMAVHLSVKFPLLHATFAVPKSSIHLDKII